MPIELSTILSELPDDAKAWVLQEAGAARYVIVPDDRFPGRRPIRFFLRREDADALLDELQRVNPKLRSKRIEAVSVTLKPSLRAIAADDTPDNADAFVVHSPTEVYEWLRDIE